MKKSIPWIIGGVVVFVLLMLFATPGLYQGRMFLDKEISQKEVSVCDEGWTKVFEGNYSIGTPMLGDRLYELNPVMSVNYSQLENLSDSGYDFKVVESYSGNVHSFECSTLLAISSLQGSVPPISVFRCNTAVFAPGGSGNEFSDGQQIVFQEGLTYFQPLSNQADPSTDKTISLYYRK